MPTLAAREAYVWEGRPRPRPLLASDWVFYAQWILALAVVAMILPSRSVGLGPLQTWPWVLPLLGFVAAGIHIVRRRSRHLAVSLDALYITEGVFWVRTRRLSCPDAQLVRLRGGSLELQGSGGERHELVGLDAVETGALREGLARARLAGIRHQPPPSAVDESRLGVPEGQRDAMCPSPPREQGVSKLVAGEGHRRPLPLDSPDLEQRRVGTGRSGDLSGLDRDAGSAGTAAPESPRAEGPQPARSDAEALT